MKKNAPNSIFIKTCILKKMFHSVLFIYFEHSKICSKPHSFIIEDANHMHDDHKTIRLIENNRRFKVR